jgi:hypothetical protein
MDTNRTLTNEPSRTLQVGEIKFEYLIMPQGDYVDTGLLVAMGHLAQEIGLPAAFRRFIHLKQKQLRYDPIDKLLTFFISLVDGCDYTSDINQRLKPYPALAQAWGLTEFAGQNAVNGTLHALKWEHLQQIEQVFQLLFEQNSLALRQSLQDPLVVDIDMKGLAVSPRSKRFEWAERGYFPNQRNQKGLQFSAAFIGAEFREVLGGHLAPGYAHVTHNLPAILQLVEKRLGTPPRRGDLLKQRARLLQAEAKTHLERAEAYERRFSGPTCIWALCKGASPRIRPRFRRSKHAFSDFPSENANCNARSRLTKPRFAKIAVVKKRTENGLRPYGSASPRFVERLTCSTKVVAIY